VSESASTPEQHHADPAAHPPATEPPADQPAANDRAANDRAANDRAANDPAYPPPAAYPPSEYAPPAYPPPAYGQPPAYEQPPEYAQPPVYPQPEPASAPWFRLGTRLRPSRAEIRWAVLVVVALAVIGVGVAAIWLNLAPRLPFQVTRPGEAQPTLPEYETFIGDDGWFFFSTLLVGLAAGVLAFLPKASRGWLMALALALGGLAGSLITWRTGQFFAPRPTHDMLQHVGDIVLYPVTLNATAFLVAEPFAAVVLYVIIAGFVAADDLDNPADRPAPAPQPAAS
jgi:hypothetical protein